MKHKIFALIIALTTTSSLFATLKKWQNRTERLVEI